MKTRQFNLRAHLRVIGSIAGKDIVGAIKNKVTFMVIVSVLFVVLLYRIVPILTSTADGPELIVADPGESILVDALEQSKTFYLVRRTNEADMLKRASVSESANLALLIPADFDQRLAQGEPPKLKGYTLYWVAEAKARELRQRAEAELTRLAGIQIQIEESLTSIYPVPEHNSLGNWAGLAIAMVLIMINLQLIPNLMLDEKQSHTLEMLLVSPASAWDIVAGKFLSGIFYSFLTGLVVLLAYRAQVLNPGMLMLAILLGAIFPSMLGLLIGQKVEQRGQLGLAIWVLIIPLIVPVLILMASDLFHKTLTAVAQVSPSGAMLNLIFIAFNQSFSSEEVLRNLGLIILWSLPLLGWLAWDIQHMDRMGSTRTAGRLLRKAQHAETRQGTQSSLPQAGSLELGSGILPEKVHPYQTTDLHRLLIIAAKDFQESWRNKVVLLVLIVSLTMILINSGMPLLLKNRMPSYVMFVDPGNSQVVAELEKMSQLNMWRHASQAELEKELGELPQTHLGLVLPPDFDQRLENGETITLQGSLVHWAKRDQANQLGQQFSAAVAQVSNGQVELQGTFKTVYPAEDSLGQLLMISISLSFVLLIIGMTLVPTLLVEEKESHTLEALMVSPASPGLVVLAKGLVGGVYGLLAALLLVAINGYLFVNLGLLLLAVLSGIAFAVALGLLIGVYSKNPTTLNLWSSLLILFLIGATIVVVFSNASWPAWVREVFFWLPSGALIRLIRAAMTGAPSMAVVWGSAGVLLSLAAVAYGLASRRCQQI